MPKVFLSKSQITTNNSEDIESENLNEISNYLNNVMDGKNYGLGLHQTTFTNENNVAYKILEEGLSLKERETILSTVSSLGINRGIDKHLQKSIMSYSYGKSNKDSKTIIVLVPVVIFNSSGEKMFLGFPPYNTDCYNNNYRIASVLDAICMSETGKGTIPKEFILGYFSNNNGQIDFIKNSSYYTFLSKKQKDDLFTSLKSRLKAKYKQINEAVIERDIDKLEELKDEEQKAINNKIKQETKNNVLNRGMNAELARNTAKDSVQITQDESATQALDYLKLILAEKKLQEENIISL